MPAGVTTIAAARPRTASAFSSGDYTARSRGVMEVWRVDIITVADDLRELMQQFGIESMAPVDSRADEGALPAMFGVRAAAPVARLSRIAMVEN